MRVLLDTSALLWFWLDAGRLPRRLRLLLDDPTSHIHVSAISAMEIATKHRIGKLPGVENVLARFEESLVGDGFTGLDLTPAHALLAGRIDAPDRDPFDRMLAAQARVEKLRIASPDEAFDRLGARRIW